jgi:hypothetical protein
LRLGDQLLGIAVLLPHWPLVWAAPPLSPRRL